MKRILLVLALLAIGSSARLQAQAAPNSIPQDLANYVAKPDARSSTEAPDASREEAR